MMRTEGDVRAALHEKAREAATKHDVLPRIAVEASRPGQSRGYLMIAAACAAVLAVAVTSLVVTRQERGHATATTPARPAAVSSIDMPLGPKFQFSFDIGALPGFHISQWQIKPGFQWALIGRPWIGGPRCNGCSFGSHNGWIDTAMVVVFDKGQFDPAALAGATPVDVNGTRGLAADVKPINGSVKWIVASIMDPANPPLLSTVAWQYAPDSWAVVAWHDDRAGARSGALQIARAVEPQQPHPALVPFKVDYLPSDVDRRSSLDFTTAGYGGEPIFARLGDKSNLPTPPKSYPATASATFGSGSTVQDPVLEAPAPASSLQVGVWNSPLSDSSKLHQKGDTLLTVAGRRALYEPSQRTLLLSCGAECTVLIQSHSPAKGISEAELIKVATHLTLASSVTDTSTWFDAAQALPH
jgi:hypothetical protein